MLKVSEHFEYYNKDHLSALRKVDGWEAYYQQEAVEESICFGKDQKRKCVYIKLHEKDNIKFCTIESSYFIGLDCLPHLGLNVYIEPKLNGDEVKLDYVRMLLDSLTEVENFDHLGALIETKFDEEWIEIESDQQFLLTPFLIAQFLSVVKHLVRKGLKKSYYTKKENLRNRVKGKILVGEQIKQNIFKNRFTNTVCQYQEFGFDHETNQFLKFVLGRVQLLLSDFGSSLDFMQQLNEQLYYCKGGFQQVSDFSFSSLKSQENNPFYKNYNLAVELGNQILKLQDHNISSLKVNGKVKHPRFWIDMSKLFELYVFKKLKQEFPEQGEVQYHKKFHRQEPDFIINEKKEGGLKAVVDAKYKPRYKNGNPSMEDARQLAGYARLDSVYKELDIEDNFIIPCYFVYPSELVVEEDFNQDEYDDMKEKQNGNILNGLIRKSTTYKEMYLQEIKILY